MNMRENLLNSISYIFKEVNVRLDENPIFQLKKVISHNNLDEVLNANQIYLGLTEKPLILLENLIFDNSKIKPDILIFASRHTSKTERPAFLVHTTGNWSKDADFGGKPYDLSKTSALLHKAGFESFREQINRYSITDFSLDIEVTHHGPTNLKVPLIFMELGSSKQEWLIKEAGVLVANAIVNAVFKYLDFKENKTQHVGLGFGGTHYAPNFIRLITNYDISFSFICPKYYIHELNEDLINKMINNTLEKVDYFIVDWKGTNSIEKRNLIPLLEEFDIPIRKTKSFTDN